MSLEKQIKKLRTEVSDLKEYIQLNFEAGKFRVSTNTISPVKIPGESLSGNIETKSSNKAIRDEILEYCEPHMKMMWASRIVGILLNCEYRDAEDRLKEYRKAARPGINGLAADMIIIDEMTNMEDKKFKEFLRRQK